MELTTVGGRRTSQSQSGLVQPPAPTSHSHFHHQHKHHIVKSHHNKEAGSKTCGRGSGQQLQTHSHHQFPAFVHNNTATSNNKKQCRYPEDPDTIEIFNDDDPIKLKAKSIGRKQGQKWISAAAPMNQYETTMISASAATLPHSYFSQVMDANPEYSYAYCEPIVTKLNKSIPDKMCGAPIPTSISSNALSKGPSAHSLRALLTKSFRKSSASACGGAAGTSERHTFTTRYGTKENIYEDVGVGNAGPRLVAAKSQSTESLNKVPVEEELKFVQKQHDRIMGELNLSIEALLMPSQDETEQMERRAAEEYQQQLDCLNDERFSPTQIPLHHLISHHHPTADFDSGISGSSSSGASYSGSMRYRTPTSMYPPRNLTIYEAPSTSSSSSQLTAPPPQRGPPPPAPPPDLMMPAGGKLSCCFYGDDDRPVPSCGGCHDHHHHHHHHHMGGQQQQHLEPIESISEKVNFWNKIGKIKGVFNVPGSPKQQSPVNGEFFLHFHSKKLIISRNS